MSAILSADDLNDFISPGVACVKPVETLPLQKPEHHSNPYEVITEDSLPRAQHPPASISLTDCLACSGCVTSAEAVLVSLQSHSEVLNALDAQPSIDSSQLWRQDAHSVDEGFGHGDPKQEGHGRLFVASVSPQVRASLAATYNVSELEAGWMIEHLLSGPDGLASGGKHGNGFAWVVDTNAMREACLVLGADEVMESLHAVNSTSAPSEDCASTTNPKKPILTSACPGWICYAEKTQPHVLPHLSRLKSPQALTGTLLKTVLSQCLQIRADQIWHVSVMPCFDKKLEASREELTDIYWRPSSTEPPTSPVRDVDCVITARELLTLADARGISFRDLPRYPLPTSSLTAFPDRTTSAFLFPPQESRHTRLPNPSAGTSGGYLHHILQAQIALHPGSTLHTTRGRNADITEYTLTRSSSLSSIDEELFKAARYYGFRNIQNLVRKLRPVKKSRLLGSRVAGARQPAAKGGGTEYTYVEVMACPGGCTNGGGQLKFEDISTGQGQRQGVSQKEWLGRVDEAYFSMDEDDTATSASTPNTEADADAQNEVALESDLTSPENKTRRFLAHWSTLTSIPLRKLAYTSFREVESDIGKPFTTGGGGQGRIVEAIAGKIGGGW